MHYQTHITFIPSLHSFIINEQKNNMMLNIQHTNTDRSSSNDTHSMLTEINEEKENLPICSYCRKSFANYSNLRHHIQIVHLKESKWDCSKCGKICSSKSNLKVHFRTHIRVKPYTCKYCEYDCMHHSSIKDHLMKNHPDKPHTSIEPGYNYNSQAVPEPDEFNAVDFDPAKFVEQQSQCKGRTSFGHENGNLSKTSPTSSTVSSLSETVNKPKRFRSETNLVQTPFLPTSPFPLWPFQLYHPSYLPAMINAIRLSTMSHLNPVPAVEKVPQRKSFEIEGILNLSLRDNKRKNLSETLSTDEDESI